MKPSKSAGKSQIFFGRNVLKEALINRVAISEIFVENKSAYDFLKAIPVKPDSKTKITEGVPKSIQSDSHQGLAFRTTHTFYSPYSIEAIESFYSVLLCNHIEDVHNLGSIIRCAASFGIKVLIHEDKKSASLTPGALKSSAGYAFRMKLFQVPNLVDVLKPLKKRGFSIAAMDINSDSTNVYHWEAPRKTALILGSEGDGIEPQVRDLCDKLIHVPMEPHYDSLNVSHAASIALSWMKHKRAINTLSP